MDNASVDGLNVVGALNSDSVNVAGALSSDSANVSGALNSGSVTVTGALNSASLDVAGNIYAAGVKPVQIYRYENKGDEANFDTGIAANDWYCVAAGWSSSYDFEETNAGANMVWTYTSGDPSTWWVRVAFHSGAFGGGDHENPDVDIICFHRNIVEWMGPGGTGINSPD